MHSLRTNSIFQNLDATLSFFQITQNKHIETAQLQIQLPALHAQSQAVLEQWGFGVEPLVSSTVCTLVLFPGRARGIPLGQKDTRSTIEGVH